VDLLNALETVKSSELDINYFDADMHDVYRDGRPPVNIIEFIDNDYYMGRWGKDLFPDNRPDIEDIFDPRNNYAEVILAGSIGYGKSYLGALGLCYMLYQLSCYVNPHKWLGASTSSPIVLMNMSVTEKKARTIIFQRVKNMVDQSPYFKEAFKRNLRLKDTLEWNVEQAGTGTRSGRMIILKPGTGEALSALGDDIYGGVCDELNFFRVIEKSKMARDGKVFDPAQELYNIISRRMKSRFMAGGQMVGKLFLVSSAQVPEDFIERRIAEAEESGELNNSIKLIRKSWWQGKRDLDLIGKQRVYGDTFFRVECGTNKRSSRVLDTYDIKTGELTEKVLDDEVEGKIIRPPVELYTEFVRDVDGAVRDFGGEVTRAVTPFITSTEVIYEAVEQAKTQKLEHPWQSETTTLQDGSRLIISKLFHQIEVTDSKTGEIRLRWKPKRHPNMPRYFHVDIALSGDALGLAISHCAGWRKIMRGFNVVEELPIIEVDLMLRVNPPVAGEIDLGNLRATLEHLRSHGMYFRKGSFDLKTMSADSMQILERRGFTVEHLSVDRKREDLADDPYEVLKDAIYENRLVMYEYIPVIEELTRLEKTPKKVDHPLGGSKDVADGLAGSVFHCYIQTMLFPPSVRDQLLPVKADAVAKDTVARRVKNAEQEFASLLKAGRVAT